MKTTTSYADLSDHDLVAETKRLAFEERRATAALIRSLMELDARRLPAILDALEDGALTLTSARRLAPQLTADNCAHVLAAARFKSKTVIEELLATLAPKPDVKPTVRKLPQPVRPDLPHQGRCTFVGPNGRCTETSLLQFHHKDRFAMEGPQQRKTFAFVAPHTTATKPSCSSPSTTPASSAKLAPTGPQPIFRPGTKTSTCRAACLLRSAEREGGL